MGKDQVRKQICRGMVCFVFLFLLVQCPFYCNAAEEPENLYARAAVLMDGDSGRVLYGKNQSMEMAMASTTKIMTCILALEYGNPEDQVVVSSNAASQPKVHLGMREGQKFYLRDLLYSLMLESHNDSAVAIAEKIGGTVEEFAGKMNRKAKELGCSSTYFITPNGLDATDQKGKHHTTAEDLARIMRYCIMESEKKEEFLKITRTQTYSFSECEGGASYTCGNHNAFLRMMPGALSGKTGFTSEAGYCYVGALQDNGRTYIVALLACGWPNNKGYKWSDTRKLMTYGLEHYDYRTVGEKELCYTIPVENGADAADPSASFVELKATAGTEELSCLLGEEESVTIDCDLPESLKAPVKSGQTIGTVSYWLDEICLRTYEIRSSETIKERDYPFCFRSVLKRFSF